MSYQESSPSMAANKKASNTLSITSDDLIPLLLAANPSIKPDYKLMSALDGTRSASSFEHRFRDYRKRAKEIRDAVDGSVGELMPVPSKPKQGKKTMGDARDGESEGKPTTVKKRKAPGGNKCAAQVSESGTTEKKAKIMKKGIARILKKEKNASAGESEGSEADTNDEAVRDKEEGLVEMKFDLEG
ncbi:hypothetical protein MMC24_002258 [Lignoscripta atroalba]|nr:hypothetical protein [Lignoscripta atroalba]